MLKLRNPANTFTTTIINPAVTADRNLTVPTLTADDTLVILGAIPSTVQTFIAAKSFLNNIPLQMRLSSTTSQDVLKINTSNSLLVGAQSTAQAGIYLYTGNASIAFGINNTNKVDTSPVWNVPLINDSVYDSKVISAPASPSSGYGRIYSKAVDANNDGLFIKVKKAGAFVEVQIA